MENKKRPTSRAYRTKPGAHRTLSLYEIEYRDDAPGCPTLRLRLWGYDREHVLDRFAESDSDGWTVLRVARVEDGRIKAHWNWHAEAA